MGLGTVYILSGPASYLGNGQSSSQDIPAKGHHPPLSLQCKCDYILVYICIHVSVCSYVLGSVSDLWVYMYVLYLLLPICACNLQV